MAFVMVLTMLSGCTKEEQNPAGTISDFESQAHIQVSAPEDESTAEEASKTPLTGEFVVSEKKYDYKDANLMLLYVENQTNRDFRVTINGKYLDEKGNVIEEETQTFDAFPAGWSNYFIFYPRRAFESFTYELETESYDPTKVMQSYADERILLATADSDGVPLASHIELSYGKLFWGRSLIFSDENYEEARALYYYANMTNDHPTMTIAASYHVLILDANGEIALADYDYYDSLGYSNSSGFAVGVPKGSEENIKHIPLKEQPRGGDESIPENFTVIMAIRQIYDYNDSMRQSLELAGLN